jgi:hypothetical protein
MGALDKLLDSAATGALPMPRADLTTALGNLPSGLAQRGLSTADATEVANKARALASTIIDGGLRQPKEMSAPPSAERAIWTTLSTPGACQA